jgi:hypothetical protein
MSYVQKVMYRVECRGIVGRKNMKSTLKVHTLGKVSPSYIPFLKMYANMAMCSQECCVLEQTTLC